MARKLRLQYEGAIYHVTVRGNGRRCIFRDDRDRERLLWRIEESCDLYEVRLYVFCLMDNHFHLLVETPRANISRFMQSVLTGYTVYFNMRHRSAGHLCQGRFGAQLVGGDDYLLTVSRYIHQNPIHTRAFKDSTAAEKARYLRSYRWSTYRGYIDRRKRYEVVEYDPVLALLHVKKSEQEARYRHYVESELAGTDEEFVKLMKENPQAIGDRSFRKWARAEYKKLKETYSSQEDIAFRRESEFVDKDLIVSAVAGSFGVDEEDMTRRMHGSLARPVAALMLCKHAGLTQRDAGKVLGYGTGAAVSLQLRRVRDLQKSDRRFQRKVSRIESSISKELK